MELEVKCCACGEIQAAIGLPLDPEVVAARIWWTKVPCPRCEAQLRMGIVPRLWH
jgi:hypothetical protein